MKLRTLFVKTISLGLVDIENRDEEGEVEMEFLETNSCGSNIQTI